MKKLLVVALLLVSFFAVSAPAFADAPNSSHPQPVKGTEGPDVQ